MAVWWKGEERATKLRRKKRKAEEKDKSLIAPAIRAEVLRRFRTALIAPFEGPVKRRRLHP